MNRNEALKILELSSNPTDDEIKKQFRKLAAKYHPDRNKEPDAEEKFKQVNAAHTFLTEKKVEVPPVYSHDVRNNLDEFLRRYHSQTKVNTKKHFISQALRITLNLTFKEAVKGCKKHIAYKRFEECRICEGRAGTYSKDPCEECKGKGSKTQVSEQGKGSFFAVTHECDKCNGTGTVFTECSGCKGLGAITVDKSLDVNIPGGIKHEQNIRLAGQGHWHAMPTFAGYSDAYLIANVQPDADFRLEGLDVISKHEIDLLLALKGGTVKVKTVDGDVDLAVPSRTKHKDKLRIDGHGAEFGGSVGSQIVEIVVKYPEDVDSLISVLENKE